MAEPPPSRGSSTISASTYDFFDQCPHRMACAKCSFYLPKESTKAQLLEAKANLLRLRQDIPLADAELTAVEDGLTAYEQLLAKLADVPTPGGSMPRQLADAVWCNWRKCAAEKERARNSRNKKNSDQAQRFIKFFFHIIHIAAPPAGPRAFPATQERSMQPGQR